jgi:hypothetical protein
MQKTDKIMMRMALFFDFTKQNGDWTRKKNRESSPTSAMLLRKAASLPTNMWMLPTKNRVNQETWGFIENIGSLLQTRIASKLAL